MGSHWSDWLFWIGGWALAAGGAALLLWAIVGDRSRGRRRCRKCWYDMDTIAPVAGVWTCPECGKRAERGKLLLRPRRRWRWAVVAFLLVLAAYPAHSVPVIRRDGWLAAVPSLVLARFAPIDDDAWSRPPQEFDAGYAGSGFIQPATAIHPLLAEIVDRINEGNEQGRAFRTFVRRFLLEHPKFDTCAIRTRARWVAGLPVSCSATYPFDRELPIWVETMCRVRMTGGDWTRWQKVFERVSIGEAPSEGTFRIEYEVAFDGVTVIRGSSDPIGVAASIDDVLSTVNSHDFPWFEPTDTLPPPVSLRIDSSDELRIAARGVDFREFWQRATAAYEFEVWRGEIRLARGRHLVEQDPHRSLAIWLQEVAPMSHRPRGPRVGPTDRSRVWVVRVRDDPLLALADYQSDARWVGALTLYFEEPPKRPCELRLVDTILEK